MNLVQTTQNKNEDHIPIFFVHIPKTAGTSFRVAAEHYFGKGRVERNYGAAEPGTTELTRQWLLGNSADYFEFYRQVCKAQKRLYTGHVRAAFEAAVFPISHTATFLRDPFTQAVSHYNHCVRWHGYGEPFETFISTRGNQQVYALAGVPVHLLGFVGITEMYEESLMLFNRLYDTDIQPMNLNTNNQKQMDTLDTHNKSLIEKAYANDIRLHRHMSAILRQRLDAVQKDLPWCHGAITRNDDTVVMGYACRTDSNTPISLVLYNGDTAIDETKAVHYATYTSRFVTPRAGHIAFRFDVRALKDKTNLKVVVKSTGQVLENELVF